MDVITTNSEGLKKIVDNLPDGVMIEVTFDNEEDAAEEGKEDTDE